MKQGVIVDSKTGIQKGELVCDIFPRKRGYEVVCVLQKTGKEPMFASHGVYMNKPAAENAIEHVFEAMKGNPLKGTNLDFTSNIYCRVMSIDNNSRKLPIHVKKWINNATRRGLPV